MTLVLADNCKCVKSQLFLGNNSPEYYTDKQKAIEAFRDHAARNTMFFAIHFNGKHVLNVVND